jgi:hypothetical protein
VPEAGDCSHLDNLDSDGTDDAFEVYSDDEDAAHRLYSTQAKHPLRLRDPRNGEESMVKLNPQSDYSALMDGFVESRVVRNLCTPEARAQLVDHKMAVLQARQVLTYIQTRIRDFGAQAVGDEVGMVTTVSATQIARDAALLHLFFTRNFRVKFMHEDQLDSKATMLAHFLSEKSFLDAGGDARTVFILNRHAAYSTERVRLRLLVTEAVSAMVFFFTMMVNRQFEDLFQPVLARLAAAPNITDWELFTYELQFLMASFIGQLDIVTTLRPWDDNKRRELFEQEVTSKFMQPVAQQPLYEILRNRKMLGAMDPLSLFPSDLAEQATAPPAGTPGGKKGPKKPKSSRPSSKTTPKNDPGTSAAKKPAAAAPVATASPGPSTAPIPYSLRSAGSVVQPATGGAATYCRVYLLEKLGLANPSGRKFKCSSSKCTGTRHTAVTVDATSTKAELEAFLATPASIDTWTSKGAEVFKATLDAYVDALP